MLTGILYDVYQRMQKKIQEDVFDEKILSDQVHVLISTCRGGEPTGIAGAKGLKTFKIN